MKRRSVESSVLASIGHEADTSVLEVEFRNGGVYRYYLVPRSVHDELLAAESIGRAFQATVRDRYRSERID